MFNFSLRCLTTPFLKGFKSGNLEMLKSFSVKVDSLPVHLDLKVLDHSFGVLIYLFLFFIIDLGFFFFASGNPCFFLIFLFSVYQKKLNFSQFFL